MSGTGRACTPRSRDAAAQFGGLHYVVNNAGVVTMRLADLTDEEWDFVVDINLKGQFIVTQLAIPLLAQRTRPPW